MTINGPHKIGTKDRLVHRPALIAVTSFALGIAIGDVLDVSSKLWFALTSCVAVLAIFFQVRRNRRNTLASSLLVICLLFVLGGLRLQIENDRAPNNIALFADDDGSPVHLIGTIASEIEIFESERGPRIPSWMEIDRSRCVIACEQLKDRGDWRRVSGRVQFYIDGHVTHVDVGDQVEFFGKLRLPTPPQNPGAFDFAKSLNRQGIDALVSADHPQCVIRLSESNAPLTFLRRWRRSIRSACHDLFVEHLSRPTHAVAASLLIGDRTGLPEDMRDSFRESGMMHLLAISGLHVGILAGFVAVFCRLVNVSHRKSAITIVFVLVLYALLTNHRPPVIRATLLISLAIFGANVTRHVDMLNVLASCAGILLIFRPNDLFDVGAQLSFLAVMGIIWSASWLRRNRLRKQQSEIIPVERPAWIEFIRPLGRWIYQAYIITAAIWIVTLPLTVSTFHLVAPIGFLLNIVLIPYVAIVLALGYTFVLVGLLFPEVASPVGLLFDGALQLFLGTIEFARDVPFGHFYPNGFPTWWLVVFYAMMIVGLAAFESRRLVFWVSRLVLCWLVLGLSLGLITNESKELRVTILSVGHGLATVIELPTGEVILYDAGNSGDGKRAERTVEQYLWSRQISRIDAVVVSHADHDHFSGLYGLLERFPVGTLFVSKPFLDFEQLGVVDLCETASRYEIPIRILQAGDHLLPTTKRAENPVSIEILHPHSHFESEHDNANSVVIKLAYRQKSLLLTGDLEKDGLDELLSQADSNVDVLMSPHHGSARSNPPRLLDWASPATVIVSTNDRDVGETLATEMSHSANISTTVESGAITITIDDQGALHIDEFLQAD